MRKPATGHGPMPTAMRALAATLALTTAVFALHSLAAAHERLSTVIAKGDGVALASICTEGSYFLMLTARPEAQPWTRDRLQAVAPADGIAIALRHEDGARGNTEGLWRTEGISRTWSIPNPRTYTRTLLILRAQEELHLRLWLPGDDHAEPGRHIPISQSTAARMYLNAVEC